MICPQCQTSNLPENKFCRECGVLPTFGLVPKDDCVGVESAHLLLGCEKGYKRGINAARQENPTGNVGDQVCANGIAKARLEFLV